MVAVALRQPLCGDGGTEISLENPFKTLMLFKLKVNGDELDVYHPISTRAF